MSRIFYRIKMAYNVHNVLSKIVVYNTRNILNV
jgi:hypothetical protein